MKMKILCIVLFYTINYTFTFIIFKAYDIRIDFCIGVHGEEKLMIHFIPIINRNYFNVKNLPLRVSHYSHNIGDNNLDHLTQQYNYITDTHLDTLSIGGNARLDLPVAVLDVVQAERLGDVGRRYGLGDVLLVRVDE